MGDRRLSAVPSSPDDSSVHAGRDPRVAAVLAVLAGQPVSGVAGRWGVEPSLLHRWVRAFVDAGTAQITNSPDPEAANRRDRFLTAFAHELRTPLAVAEGWSDLLAEGDLPPAMTEQTITRLADALHRLRERVVDVGLLGSSSLGLVRLDLADTTVGEVVADLDVPVSDEDAAVPLTVDLDLFRRVVRDLLGAASLEPAARSLAIDVRQEGPWVEVRVVREGDPIDPRALQALLEPFDVNDDATGVTIGLYLARALTVAHGGTLGLEQDDSGLVVWVRIPAPRNEVTTTSTTTERDFA